MTTYNIPLLACSLACRFRLHRWAHLSDQKVHKGTVLSQAPSQNRMNVVRSRKTNRRMARKPKVPRPSGFLTPCANACLKRRTSRRSCRPRRKNGAGPNVRRVWSHNQQPTFTNQPTKIAVGRNLLSLGSPKAARRHRRQERRCESRPGLDNPWGHQGSCPTPRSLRLPQ